MKSLKSLGAAACIAATAAGCASTPSPSQVDAWLASGRAPPPPQASCAAVANLDLGAIERERQERIAQSGQAVGDGFVQMPASAEALIPADAVVVIRANLPPGGLYSNDVRSVVWKTADGHWMVWRQNRNFGEPPPPPPPPPPPDSPEYEAWRIENARPKPPPTDDERWPPRTGRLAPEAVAAIEAALADPCRAWDPDYFPYDQPLLRRDEYGERRRICPPDGGYYAADITEPGRPRRGIGAGCINDTPTFRLISATAYAGPEG